MRSSRRNALTLGIVLAALTAGVVPARGQWLQEELVKDICTEDTRDSEPLFLGVLGGAAILFAIDDQGPGVWRSDGTGAGTELVARLDNFLVTTLGVIRGTLLFAHPTPENMLDVWRCDGTPAGTRRFARIPTGPDSLIRQAVLGDHALLLVGSRNLRRELWRTDGETAEFVAEVTASELHPDLHFLIAAGARVLLAGEDAQHGVELWASDGTAGGTAMVMDIRPGPESSRPSTSASWATAGRMYFVANEGEKGMQLWVSDGTSAGTRRACELTGGISGVSPPRSGITLGEVLLFQASDAARGSGLWRSDGTPAGSWRVNGEAVFERAIERLDATTAVFEAADAPHGRELWRSDGTPAGTRLIADLSPGAQNSFVNPTATVAGGRVFVSVLTGGGGPDRVWATDGTAAGTLLMDDGTGRSAPDGGLFGAAVGSVVLFSGRDLRHGRELWGTAGTAGSTHLVRDLNLANFSSAPAALAAVGETLFFVTSNCRNAYIDKLWRTDGTEAGTVPLVTLTFGGAATSSRALLAPGNGGMFFAADDGTTGLEIWHSDGTAVGTRLFVDLQPGTASSQPSGLVWQDGALYFAATETGGRRCLWRSDGTAPGTVCLFDGLRDPPYPYWLTAAGGRLFFLHDIGAAEGAELWASDGTQEGTCYLTGRTDGVEIAPGTARPRASGGALYFVAGDAVHGDEMWRSDGTPAGTGMIKDIAPADAVWGAGVYSPYPVGGRVFFSAPEGVHGFEPWVSDGTTDGTRLVADIWPGRESSEPWSMNGIMEGPGATAYFAAYEPRHGAEIWRSDGTPEGTGMIADLLPFPYLVLFMDGRPLANRFVFSWAPYDPRCGANCPFPTQLWETRGAPATTRPISETRPTDLRYRISYFESMGPCVYFSGADPFHGEELRKACPPPPRLRQRLLTPER